MWKIRRLMCVLAMILGMIFSIQVVHASESGHEPNTGEYVYQDREYITNGQYDRLERLNDEIDRDAHPQKLYLIIIHSASLDPMELAEPWSVKERVANVFSDEDAAKYMFGETDDDDEDEDQNNYLIYDTKNGELTFQPSGDAADYITHLKFWCYRLSLLPSLKSDDESTQIAAVFKMVDKLGPNLQRVSQSERHLKAMDYQSISNILGIGIFIAVIWLMGMYLIYFGSDSHSGGQISEDNPEYDAGFDEGTYYGSHNKY